MAEQLIYLDIGDGIAEVVTRLRGAKQDHVVLVIPKRAVIAHSPINFKVIKQQADALKLVLSIITQDEIAKNFASQVGLKLLDQLGEAPTAAVATPTLPSAPKTSSYQDNISSFDAGGEIPVVRYKKLADPLPQTDDLALEMPSQRTKKLRAAMRWDWHLIKNFKIQRHHQILFGFILMGLILVGAVSFFVAPKAFVDIEVQSEPFAKQFTITLADEQDLRAAGPNVLTGRFLEVTREDVSSFKATGEENRGEKSSGQIRIVNHTNVIQGIVKNTRFESSAGLIFRINEEVLVSPARSGSPGTAVVSATSDGGGTAYNVSAPTKLTVPGLGDTGIDLVYGEVVGTFAGGTDDIIKVVSEDDINQAKEEATKNIFVAAEGEINNQLKRGEEVLPFLIQNDVIDAVPSATAGAKRDEFEVRVQSRSWVIVVGRKSINEAISNAAVFEVPEGKQVTQQTVANATVEVLESNFLTREIQLAVKLDGRVGPQLDIESIRQSLANQPVAKAVEQLQSDANITTGSVEIVPTFLTRMPMLLNNIRIQVIYLGE
ncbi:MAG: hypothetical protein PHR51_01470 [Patescibacteria group bacterium]|nr:hypothetical protein [Patescibacteria group bacterium]